MNDQHVGLAIIGFSTDLQGYRDAAARLQGATFTVVVGADQDMARAMAEVVGAPTVVATLDEALEAHRSVFDAIVLLGPPTNDPGMSSRAAMISQAARAGKHIHVEAPVASNLDEVKAAIDACEKAEVCFSIGNTLRALPSNRVIKDRIAANKLGKPGMLRGHQWSSVPRKTRGGRLEHIYGDIDLAAWFFEALPSEIYAVCREPGKGNFEYVMPDYLQIHLGFPGGGMAVFDFSTVLPAGQEYRSLYMLGSSGAAYADDHHNAHLLYQGGDPKALISHEGQTNVLNELQDFVDAIRDQRSPAVTGEDACIAHQIADGVARSLESGKVLTAKGGVYALR